MPEPSGPDPSSQEGEPVVDGYSGAELGRAVARIEQDLREVRTDVKALPDAFVTTREFDAWRTGIGREVNDLKGRVDGVQTSVDDGIAGLRAEIRASTPQWWVIAALGVSTLAAVIALINAVR